MSLIAGVEGTPAAWRVVFACFLSAVFAWGFGFYAHGIYLVELRQAHGWSTGLISSIVTGHYVLGALLLPRIAEAIGRFGPRAVFLAGLAVSGVALLLLPSVEAPWQLALLYAVMAPGWNATSLRSRTAGCRSRGCTGSSRSSSGRSGSASGPPQASCAIRGTRACGETRIQRRCSGRSRRE